MRESYQNISVFWTLRNSINDRVSKIGSVNCVCTEQLIHQRIFCRLTRIFLIDIQAITFVSTLGSIEDMCYLLFLQEGGVADGRLVSDIKAGHHLVTVHSPATAVQAGEQPSVFLLCPEIVIKLRLSCDCH